MPNNKWPLECKFKGCKFMATSGPGFAKHYREFPEHRPPKSKYQKKPPEENKNPGAGRPKGSGNKVNKDIIEGFMTYILQCGGKDNRDMAKGIAAFMDKGPAYAEMMLDSMKTVLEIGAKREAAIAVARVEREVGGGQEQGGTKVIIYAPGMPLPLPQVIEGGIIEQKLIEEKESDWTDDFEGEKR
ncbi:hypothetical protein LCGC14_0234840 [marine sediment metagenome]|uniref:Uncharacterized protein n=1 Tax=marine sediment metagenome TaxID=412755 RepID=A0A0F9XCZ5_9ZZZZ